MPKICLWDNDPDVEVARRRLRSAQQRHPDTNHQHLEAELRDTYTRRREEIIMDMSNEISQHHEAGRSQAVWRTIDNITGRKTKLNAIMEADSMEDRLENIAGYFRGLLNAPPVNVDLPALTLLHDK